MAELADGVGEGVEVVVGEAEVGEVDESAEFGGEGGELVAA